MAKLMSKAVGHFSVLLRTRAPSSPRFNRCVTSGSMSSPPHIVVVGAGGVGCWLAALLASASQRNPNLARVSLVARGRALECLREHGLRFTVKDPAGSDQTITAGPGILNAAPSCAAIAEAGDRADYVILGVKTWQVADAAKDAAMVLRAGSGCIVTTQNGVSAPYEVLAACPGVPVLAGVAKVIAFRDDTPGGPLNAVRMAGEIPDVLMVGEMETPSAAAPSQRTAQLREILREAGVTVPAPEDENMLRELWKKAVMMCSMGPVCALARADIHTVVRIPSTMNMLLAAMKEIAELSKKFEGCYVGDDVPERTLKYLHAKVTPGGCPSTCRDIVCGRPSEIREFSGALVKMGQDKGVEMPVHAFLSAMLEPQEAMARGELLYSLEGVPGTVFIRDPADSTRRVRVFN